MTINVPRSWSDVTVGEYQAFRQLLKEDGDPYLTECAIISTFTGADMNDIMAITREDHGKIMTKHLAFLSSEVTGKLKNRVKLGGKWYHIETDLKNITGGQYIDLTHFMKDENVDGNLHNLIACLCTPLKFGIWKQPYNGKNHASVAEQIKSMPITYVKPITDFFLSSYVELLTNIAAYLMKTGTEMKERAMEQLISSSTSMDGFTQYTASRTVGGNFGTSTST